ncbi:MAG: DUF4382 domain-containing protein [Candidatus Eiseniibacteriota bacterium]
MTSRSFLVRLAPLLLLALQGCSGPPTMDFGTVRMRLIDAPAAIDAVNIVVTEVSVHPTGAFASTNDEGGSLGAVGANETAWEVVNDAPATYDLLTLRGGAFATLAEAIVPAGAYTQIRLKIGEGSNVVVDGTSYPLVVPSGAKSGLKLIHNFTVASGGVADLTVDFDAEKSVFETVDGRWHLKPTITVTSTSASGTTDRVGR